MHMLMPNLGNTLLLVHSVSIRCKHIIPYSAMKNTMGVGVLPCICSPVQMLLASLAHEGHCLSTVKEIRKSCS